MREIMTNYSKWYNKKYIRKGHFWEQRYNTSIVEDDEHILVCMRYINRNPLRARIVDNPNDYPWSGYSHYAYGERNVLLDDHPTFIGLSPYQKVRSRKYREFVETPFDSEKDKRNKDISTAFIFGSKEFKEKIKERLSGNSRAENEIDAQ